MLIYEDRGNSSAPKGGRLQRLITVLQPNEALPPVRDTLRPQDYSLRGRRLSRRSNDLGAVNVDSS